MSAAGPAVLAESGAGETASGSLAAWRLALGPLLGALLHVVTNAVAITATVPWPAGGLGVRVAHHLADAGQSLALGAIFAAATFAGGLVARRHALVTFGVYVAASTLLMFAVLAQTLERQANAALDGTLSTPLFVIFVGGAGLAVPVAHVVADWLGRRRWWALGPVVVGLGAMVANHVVFPDDYEMVHVAVGWGAATMLGAALAPGLLARLAPLARARPGAAWAAAAAWLAAGSAAVLVHPQNQVRLEQFKEPGALGAWTLAATLWSLPELPAAHSEDPWISPRASLPDVPPTSPGISPESPVVVLLTVDAVRADVLDDVANDARFPTFASMKRTGTAFRRARSPGSQTSVSLSAMFSGKYFSELYWQPFGEGSARFLYPSEDPTPRFPEILAAAGVRTVSFMGVNFLGNAFGIGRGFSEERIIPKGRQHAIGREVIDPLVDVLQTAGPGPLFVYAHLMEPHAPYNRGTVQEGPIFERYLSEIELADRDVGRVARVLFGGPLRHRAYLIVASDHGEAFGEHGTWKHTKTLYEELVRVPLLVRGHRVARQTVDEPVSLVDLGPTLLDLFGLSTPAHFKGESLVPILKGEAPALTRPILAEGRLRRALVEGDLKVIVDERRKVVEVYDLGSDPGETKNLFDADPARAGLAIGRLIAFFDTHGYRAPGYTTPYKP